MKQKEISSLPKLNSERYENIFSVHETEDKRYYYNLIQTVVLPSTLPPSLYEIYIIKYGDTWPLISFKYYRTPNLWWIILETNKIINPIKFPDVGTSIKVPTVSLVKSVLKNMA